MTCPFRSVTFFLRIFAAMKKTLVILTLTLFTLQLKAQDTDVLLDLIKNEGQTVSTIEADLHHVKVKDGVTTTQDGTLHYVAPYNMAAVFTTGQYLIANEKKLKVDIGIFHGNFRLYDGGIPNALTNVFLYAFQGRFEDLAKENDFNLSVIPGDDEHTLVFTAKKKPFLGIGYQSAVFKVNAHDLRVKEINTTDFKGTVETYSLHNEKYGIEVDMSRFQM